VNFKEHPIKKPTSENNIPVIDQTNIGIAEAFGLSNARLKTITMILNKIATKKIMTLGGGKTLNRKRKIAIRGGATSELTIPKYPPKTADITPEPTKKL